LIVKQTAEDKLQGLMNPSLIEKVALGIFNMIGFVNFIMASKYFALQRKALSIRDILSMIDFIQCTLSTAVFPNTLDGVHSAFRHAVNLVIVDGLCLGIDVSGDRQKVEILNTCCSYLIKLGSVLFFFGNKS
jgi:microsomal dipeptidase-like Zn-dependent dipeptidase